MMLPRLYLTDASGRPLLTDCQVKSSFSMRRRTNVGIVDVCSLQGQRARSLKAFHERHAKQEEEKAAVDLEEAKYQLERRKEAIGKAKTLLYYQSDRIKSFHVSS